MSVSSPYRLKLFGAFHLTAPDGSTVRLGRKAQALVAILSVENGASVTRSRLQDLLWSLSGPKHGRDSLKKALQALRKAFGSDAKQILFCEDDRVWLCPTRVKPDWASTQEIVPHRDFLEGMDIPEPGFEEWLRTMRQRLPVCVSRTEQVSGARSAFFEQRSRLRISVLKTTIIGDGMAGLTGDVLLSRIIDTLTQADLVELVDLRDADKQSLGGSDAFLTMRVVSVGMEVQVQMALRAATDNALLWSRSRHFETRALSGKFVDETVSRFVEEIQVAARQMSQALSSDDSAVTRLAMEGIENLFRLAPENLEQAAKHFAQAIDIRPSGSLYAWYAFLTPFRFEQCKGADLDDLRNHAEHVLRRALELDPHNPMVRSLLAHVFSFLFRDFQKADAVLSPLRGQPPDTPMYHFSEAMLHLYRGKKDEARRFAFQASQTGKVHPYSYAFSTSLCMIDALDQKAEEAISHGQRALATMPSVGQIYEPTLRYMTMAYASAGRIEDARATWKDLQKLNPANSLEKIRETKFPIAADHMRQSLSQALSTISGDIS